MIPGYLRCATRKWGSAMGTREDLIRKALLDLMDSNVAMYSSEELLTAAGVTEEEVKAFQEYVNQQSDKIARDSAKRRGKELK